MRTVLVSCDGVICERRAGGLHGWADVRFVPGALTALRWFRIAGFQTILLLDPQPQAPVERTDADRRIALQILLHGGHIHATLTADAALEAALVALPGGIDPDHTYYVRDRTEAALAIHGQPVPYLLMQPRAVAASTSGALYVAADLIDAACWLFEHEGLTPPYPLSQPPHSDGGSEPLALALGQ